MAVSIGGLRAWRVRAAILAKKRKGEAPWAPVPSSTLANGLVSYWKLDEESGTRYDSVGTNHLTDNNTVGFAAGKSGNAASFVGANSESLSRADVVIPESFTVAFWLKAPGIEGDKDILGCAAGWPTAVQFHFRPSPSIMSLLVGSGGSYVQATGAGTGAVNDGNWHLWVGAFDTTDQKARLYEDGDNQLGASPSAALGSAHYSAPSSMFAGAGLLGAATQELDEVALWSRVLTSDERAELYAAGAGKFYPFA